MAALAMLLAAPVSAKGGRLVTGFTDDLFSSPNASVRNHWVDRAVDARAGIIRTSVNWRTVVGSNPPADPTNPADPDYKLGELDDFVMSARARGLDVLLTVYGAPKWAEGKSRPGNVNTGAWKPQPKPLGQFGQALARRYSGHFRNLPRVRFFEAWTEPNLRQYLAPQVKHHKLKSPDRYRRMLNAFYAGVKKGQPKAKVIAGATAPFGDSDSVNRMRPLLFLKKLFCLSNKFKPKKCPHKPHLDILSHHPINFFTKPTHKAFNRNDIPVANFDRVRRVIRAAERSHHVRPNRHHHPLWADEILWYSDPPTSFGVPVRKQAKWLEQALYLLWKQGASVVVNFHIRDEPFDPKHPQLPYSGIFFASGKKKPAYRAWRFPFVTHRKSRHKVKAWTKPPQSGKLKIQTKRHGHWRTKKKLHVHNGAVVTRSFRLPGGAKVRGKIKHSKSLTWHQGG